MGTAFLANEASHGEAAGCVVIDGISLQCFTEKSEKVNGQRRPDDVYTIAVDIGGTFTDVIAIDNRNGTTAMGKALTTPGDLQLGVLEGLADAAANLSTSVPALLGQTER